MIRNDTTWTNAIKWLERTIKTEIVSSILNHSYIDELSTVSINQVGCSSDVILFGEICTNKLTFKVFIDDSSLSPVKGDILTVKQHINNLVVQVGKFMIEEIKDDDNSNYFEVTAYDCIYPIINKDLTIDLTSTSTGGDVLTSINTYLSSHYNVAFSSSDISKASEFVFSGIEDGTYKISDVLTHVMQYIGYNIKSNNQGVPTLYWWSNVDYTISYDDQMMNGFTRNTKQLVCVDSITVKVNDETSYTVTRDIIPTGDYEHINLSFENKYFTQAQLTSLKSRLDVLMYQPCSVNFRGNPAIEIGDVVKVERKDGSTINAIVCDMSTTLTGMSATLTCKGKEESTSTKGSLTNKIESVTNELHTDYINANEIKASYADIQFSNVVAESVDNVVAKQLLAKQLSAEVATFGSIKGANLTLAEDTVTVGGITYDKYRKITKGSTDIYYEFDTTISTYKPRIIIGKHDDSDAYNMTIYDTDGETELFNATGVTFNGLLDANVAGVINSDNYTTKIQAKKLDISGIIDGINEHEQIYDVSGNPLYIEQNGERYYLQKGVGYIKASGIYFDAEKQTLDVLYSKLDDEGGTLQSAYQFQNGLLNFLIASGTYTLTETKPDKWESTYWTYYTKQDNEYTLVPTSEITPIWESNKYYYRSSDISNISMTDKSIKMISENIDLTGKVTFSSFSSSDKKKIEDSIGATEGLGNGTTVIDGACITTGTINADKVTVSNLVVGKNVTMGPNAKISWDNVTSQPTIPNKTSDLTNDSDYTTMSAVEDKGYETASSIKSTVITKDYIETLKVKAGSVDAENISGTTISGKTISGGTIKSANIQDDRNNTVISTNGVVHTHRIVPSGSALTLYASSDSSDCAYMVVGDITYKDISVYNNDYFWSAGYFWTSCNDVGYKHKNTTSTYGSVEVNFGVGKSGLNRGIYDKYRDGWMIYRADGQTQTPTWSDIRLKNVVNTMDKELTADMLESIDPVIFTYKTDLKDIPTQYAGIIAQDYKQWCLDNNIDYHAALLQQPKTIDETEMQEMVDDINVSNEEVWLNIDYTKFIPELWTGWKYHQDKIKQLEEENSSLKDRLDALEKRLLKLEQN